MTYMGNTAKAHEERAAGSYEVIVSLAMSGALVASSSLGPTIAYADGSYSSDIRALGVDYGALAQSPTYGELTSPTEQQTLEDHKAQLDRIQSEMDEVAKGHAPYQSAYEESLARKNAAQNALSMSQSEIEAIKSNAAQMIDATVSGAKNEADQAARAVADAERELAKAEKDALDADEAYKKASAEAESAKEAYENALASSNGISEEKLAQLKKAADDAQSALSDAKNEVDSASARLAAAEKAREESAAALSEAESSANAAASAKAEAERNAASAQAALDAANAKKQEVLEGNEALKEQIQQEIDAAKAELAQANQDLSDAVARQTEAEGAIESAKAGIAEAEQAVVDARSELTSAEGDLSSKQEAYDNAQADFTRAEEVKDGKQSALDEANERVSEAQHVLDEKEAVKASLEKEKAELEKVVTEKQGALQAANAAKEEADRKLLAAKQNLENAEVVGDAYDFFEWVGCTEALAILNDASLSAGTVRGDANDASSFANLKASIEMIKTCADSYRIGYDTKVNYVLMAMAIVNANRSADPAVWHSGQFNVKENLSWGKEDPYTWWYTGEMNMYDQATRSKQFVKRNQFGEIDATDVDDHGAQIVYKYDASTANFLKEQTQDYWNISDVRRNLTGFAISKYTPNPAYPGKTPTMCQVFFEESSSDSPLLAGCGVSLASNWKTKYSVSVSTAQTELANFEAYCESNKATILANKQKLVDAAEKEVAEAVAAVGLAAQAIEDANAEVQSKAEAISQAGDDVEAAKAPLAAAKEAQSAAQSAFDAASADLDGAQTALDAASGALGASKSAKELAQQALDEKTSKKAEAEQALSDAVQNLELEKEGVRSAQEQVEAKEAAVAEATDKLNDSFPGMEEAQQAVDAAIALKAQADFLLANAQVAFEEADKDLQEARGYDSQVLAAFTHAQNALEEAAASRDDADGAYQQALSTYSQGALALQEVQALFSSYSAKKAESNGHLDNYNQAVSRSQDLNSRLLGLRQTQSQKDAYYSHASTATMDGFLNGTLPSGVFTAEQEGALESLRDRLRDAEAARAEKQAEYDSVAAAHRDIEADYMVSRAFYELAKSNLDAARMMYERALAQGNAQKSNPLPGFAATWQAAHAAPVAPEGSSEPAVGNAPFSLGAPDGEASTFDERHGNGLAFPASGENVAVILGLGGATVAAALIVSSVATFLQANAAVASGALAAEASGAAGGVETSAAAGRGASAASEAPQRKKSIFRRIRDFLNRL